MSKDKLVIKKGSKFLEYLAHGAPLACGDVRASGHWGSLGNATTFPSWDKAMKAIELCNKATVAYCDFLLTKSEFAAKNRKEKNFRVNWLERNLIDEDSVSVVRLDSCHNRSNSLQVALITKDIRTLDFTFFKKGDKVRGLTTKDGRFQVLRGSFARCKLTINSDTFKVLGWDAPA